MLNFRNKLFLPNLKVYSRLSYLMICNSLNFVIKTTYLQLYKGNYFKLSFGKYISNMNANLEAYQMKLFNNISMIL